MLLFPLFRPASGVVLSALTVVILPFSAGAAQRDCAATSRQVSRQVAATPERVLLIVEDTLVVSDSCACEVVKSAIVAASASPKLTGQIVLVAVTAAPAKAVLIAECAKAASPDAADDIDVALRKALGPDAATPAAAAASENSADPGTTTTLASGKEPAAKDKNPAAPEPTAETKGDFGLSPVAIGGVYLVYPGSGGSPQLVEGDDGRLYYIGPQGKRVPLDPLPPRRQMSPRPPAIIIITPPTPTSSENIPQDPIPLEPTPLDPTPLDPAL